jgi:hypothetical protein
MRNGAIGDVVFRAVAFSRNAKTFNGTPNGTCQCQQEEHIHRVENHARKHGRGDIWVEYIGNVVAHHVKQPENNDAQAHQHVENALREPFGRDVSEV